MRDLLTPQYRWIGHGIYTPAEASRLTGISVGRITRWIRGYSFVRGGERRTSPPIIDGEVRKSQIEPIVLTFRDLIEVMCVHGFLQTGVRWPLLRKAHELASEVLDVPHPFATRKFLTDGRSVLLKVGEKALLDLVSDQYALLNILRPFLKPDGIDFEGDFASRWWPMGKHQPIIIDAGRSFGQPIVTEGVPTEVLHLACIAEERARLGKPAGAPGGRTVESRGPTEKTVRHVATWYCVPPRSVKAAVAYENRLAA